MRYLIVIAMLVIACGGSTQPTTAQPPASVAPIAKSSSTPAPTPRSTEPMVIRLVAALDVLQEMLYDGEDTSGWFVATGEMYAEEAQGFSSLPPEVAALATELSAGIQALIDGGDGAAQIQAILAMRPALAALVPNDVPPPPATPAVVKPVVIKGKGEKTTKPFTLTGGDYTVVMAGKGDGNVVLWLYQRGGDYSDLLVNEIKHSKYRYDTVIYGLSPGQYYMEMDGVTWTVTFTPLK